jgi:hypothetical protein
MQAPDPAYCPMHAFDPIKPVFVGTETADYTFTCPSTDHPGGAPRTWAYVPERVGLAGDSLGLGLDVALPKAISSAVGEAGTVWVEYGLIERAYAIANPEDWMSLLRVYGHTEYQPLDATIKDFPYTASKYLARSLGALGRRGDTAHEFGPGTGRWSYDQPISYYACTAGGDWDSRQTWEASGHAMTDYMPIERPN